MEAMLGLGRNNLLDKLYKYWLFDILLMNRLCMLVNRMLRCSLEDMVRVEDLEYNNAGLGMHLTRRMINLFDNFLSKYT